MIALIEHRAQTLDRGGDDGRLAREAQPRIALALWIEGGALRQPDLGFRQEAPWQRSPAKAAAYFSAPETAERRVPAWPGRVPINEY